MDLISKQTLVELASEHGAPRISIYLPLDRTARGPAADHVPFKNLLREAERRLRADGFADEAIAHALASAHGLLQEKGPWQHGHAGLAVLCAADGIHWFQLPSRPREAVYVGDRFHLRPLLPLLAAQRPFHILALSQAHVRLLACDGVTAKEVRIEKMPASLEEALGKELEPEYLQLHSGVHAYGGKGAVVFSGRGSGPEETKQELPRFLERVDAPLVATAAVRDQPLVLAGVEYLVAMYRQVSHHPQVTADAVLGNPDGLSLDQLRSRGCLAVQPALRTGERRAAVRYRELAGSHLACADLSRALEAARAGAVEALFVATDAEAWGRVEPGAVETHPARQAGDQELFDLLTALTLAGRGEVYASPPAEVPSGGALAAVLRY